jgi:DNA transposition AAA+ family ATPase
MDYNQELLSKTKEFIGKYNNEHGGKGAQAYLSKQLDISAAQVSQYLSQQYPNPETIEPKLQEFFTATKEGSVLYKAPDYVETSISSNVYKTIKLAYVSKSMAIECGDAGVGKTKAALKYKSDYPYNTILITANPCNNSSTTILRSLCRALGVSARNSADMFEELAKKLEAPKIIIIDESQHLRVKAIETLRSLWDLEQTQIGIVFIGNHDIISQPTGRSGENYAQLTNRIMRRKRRITQDISQQDILAIFPELQNDKDNAAKFLLGIAKSKESLRGTVNLFTMAKNNGNISLAGLAAMAKSLNMELY